jgi:hypothetical protein
MVVTFLAFFRLFIIAGFGANGTGRLRFGGMVGLSMLWKFRIEQLFLGPLFFGLWSSFLVSWVRPD